MEAWLSTRRELGVRHRRDEVRRGGLRCETDHGAVDVDTDAPVGRASRTCQQVRASRGEVEDDVLVDLSLVQTFVDRLLSPLSKLRVPQGAVGLRVPWIIESWKVAEHVEQVAAIP